MCIIHILFLYIGSAVYRTAGHVLRAVSGGSLVLLCPCCCLLSWCSAPSPKKCWSSCWVIMAQKLSLYMWLVLMWLDACTCVIVWKYKCKDVYFCLQAPAVKAFESLSGQVQLYSCAALVLLSFIFLLLARFSFRWNEQICFTCGLKGLFTQKLKTVIICSCL